MFVQGSHTFTSMRYLGIPVMYAHITLKTFNRFAQNSTVECLLAMYGPAMHIATLNPWGWAREEQVSKTSQLNSRQSCHRSVIIVLRVLINAVLELAKVR